MRTHKSSDIMQCKFCWCHPIHRVWWLNVRCIAHTEAFSFSDENLCAFRINEPESERAHCFEILWRFIDTRRALHPINYLSEQYFSSTRYSLTRHRHIFCRDNARHKWEYCVNPVGLNYELDMLLAKIVNMYYVISRLLYIVCCLPILSVIVLYIAYESRASWDMGMVYNKRISISGISGSSFWSCHLREKHIILIKLKL